MSHQLRVIVKVNDIAKIKEEFISNTKYGLFITDHKNIFFPLKFLEGQIKQIGNQGMSLFGFIIISH